jgi:ribose transport system substrate-binding protein
MKTKLLRQLWIGSLLLMGAARAETYQVAVIPKSTGIDYWNAVHTGALKAKAELAAEGVMVEILWNGTEREDQVDQQKKLVTDFTAKKVSAIVLAPVHAQALVGPVDAAIGAKIPVIIIDSPVNSIKTPATVATNNYKAGLLAGRSLADAIGGKGKVIMLRYLNGHGSTQPRESGFLDAIKKYPGIEVVSSDQHSGATVSEAEAAARSLLSNFGADLAGIYTPNQTSTTGMLHALRESGLAGKRAFVGFDSSDEHVEALRKGELNSMLVQQPFMMGYLGVRTAVAILQGKPVEKDVDTNVKLVTKQNLETPEIKQLLNPASE